MVVENLLGDILSDLTAGLIGGMGIAPSADLGDRHAVFQPCHGTAPDLAGKGVANPVATMLSCAMLLDHLGRRNHDDGPTRAARKIHSAVALTLADSRFHTADVGGQASTDEVTRAVLSSLMMKQSNCSGT